MGDDAIGFSIEHSPRLEVPLAATDKSNGSRWFAYRQL